MSSSRPSGPFARGASADLPEPPRLTARQQQILDWIRGHMEATGMPPTRAEIATGLGFSTASSAEDHLQALAQKGRARTHARRRARLAAARVARRADPGLAAAGGPRGRGQPHPRRRAHRRRNTGSTPRCSRRTPTTCCACAAPACRMPASSTATSSSCTRPADARSGQIVVARLGEEVTVKRLKRRGREITLMAENAAFAPIVVDPEEDALRHRRRRGGRDPAEPFVLIFYASDTSGAADGHHPLSRS